MIAFINFISLLVCLVISVLSAIVDWPDIVTPITFGVALIITIIENRIFLRLIIHWLWNTICRRNIRVSMSYIYIIKIGNKYLLVKNTHNAKYQLVGGKYKFFPEAKSNLEKLSYSEDIKLGVEGTRKDDIAFFIPSKNLFKFLKWFDSGNDREIDHFREFHEELLESKKTVTPIISDKELFNYINFRKVKTINTGIRKSPQESGFNCLEYNQYDILEPKFTLEQEAYLKGLAEKGDSDDLKWASKELIATLGFQACETEKKYGINEHTKWCVEEKYSK